jgi:nucleoside recognition membrane protein YjiH
MTLNSMISIFLYRFAGIFWYILPRTWFDSITYPIDRLRWWFEDHLPKEKE